jgi:hypothetical protein
MVGLDDSVRVSEGVRISMRSYFSAYLLWAAERAVVDARAVEAARGAHRGFDPQQRAYVINGVLASANFLEAMVNELYQDAHDGHGTSGDGYVAPLSSEVRYRLSLLWTATDEGSKLRALEKYQLLLEATGHSRMDQGAQPYQDAALVVRLRNAIAHYQPESLAVDTPAQLEKALRGKFDPNPLMAGSAGNPWWPDHCFGSGCAAWASRAVTTFADVVCATVGIEPNYARLRRDSWAGLGRSPADD